GDRSAPRALSAEEAVPGGGPPRGALVLLRLRELRESGVGAAPVDEKLLVVTAGGFAIPERRGGARAPEEAERPVGPACEGPLELRPRFARPTQLAEALPEELRPRLDGSGAAAGRR